MNNYAPRPGSAAEAAVEYLRKKGGPARSGEIAEAIGIESKGIAASLAAAVENGVLIACDVQVPGAPPQKEYRLSGGGKPITWREPKPARAPVAVEATPKACPAHPRGESRPKVTGKLLRAAAEGRRKTAKSLPVTEVPWKAEQPAVERPQMEPPSPFRCAVFSDGSFEIVTLERGDIWLSPSETRAMVGYLRTIGRIEEAA